MRLDNLTILKIIAIILLSITFLDVDYFFYQLLRWYIGILSLYLAYLYYENKSEKWTWIFGIITIIFNPIAPIHFWRELWSVMDVLVIIILIINMKFSKSISK